MARRDGRVGVLRAREAVCGLAVGENEHDLRIGEGGSVLGINERLQVGACSTAVFVMRL